MKNLVMVALATFTLTQAAMADFVPGRIRPGMRAELESKTATHAYPRPALLTLNYQDGAQEPVTFTLVSDTGIRCITTPCPSTVAATFEITSILNQKKSVVYEAVEVGHKNAVFAPRYLRVEQSIVVRPGKIHPRTVTVWEVELTDVMQDVSKYQGYPEYLAVTL